MGDISVEDYLRSWGLEAYVEKFKNQAVDLNALLLLAQDDIKELIPIIGHRTLFVAQINALRNVINASVLNLQAEEATKELSSSGQDPDPNIQVHQPSTSNDIENVSKLPVVIECYQEDTWNDLRKYLKTLNEGKALLVQYEGVGLLDNSARRRLCNAIINRELQGNPDKTIESKRFYELAFQITKIFTKESAAVYFTPYLSFGPTQKTAAKGKLLDTYRQKRKEFVRCGLIASRKRNSSSAPASPALKSTRIDEAVENLPDGNDTDVEQYLLWLKNSSDPWVTVQLYWELTRKLRFQKYAEDGMTIADYFNDYRALGLSGGLYLLLDDFNNLYPDCRDKLFENWPLHRNKIIELAKKRVDPASAIQLAKFFESVAYKQNYQTI